jgi:hypothetical protein
MTDIEQIKKEYEPYEVLEMLCWADVVMHVMYHKEAEDISFCEGKSCNYCGRFPSDPSTQQQAGDHP